MAETKVRKRGVVLNHTGLHRLNLARREAELRDNEGMRFTLEELCDRTQLSLKTITKVLDARTTVDRQSLEAFFAAFGLILEKSDYGYPTPPAVPNAAADPVPTAPPLSTTDLPIPVPAAASPAIALSWGEAPDVSNFHGRQAELEQLQQWVGHEGCRLVGVLGMGGMGKT
ncbi:hypothetical protein C7271_21030, partial [filamentous cyanobacterium CCP5]